MWLPGTKTASIIKKAGGKGNGNGMVAVAIEKDNKGSRHALRWAADTLLLRGQTLVLIHVLHTTSPSREAILCNINTNSPPASPHVNTSKDLFHTFHCYCSRKDIQCLDVLIEDIDVVKGITEYVSYAAIENLVLGPSRHSSIRFKSSTPSNILKGAPDFCTVYVISKGRISSVRSATRTAPHASPLLRHLVVDDEEVPACLDPISSNSSPANATVFHDQVTDESQIRMIQRRPSRKLIANGLLLLGGATAIYVSVSWSL